MRGIGSERDQGRVERGSRIGPAFAVPHPEEDPLRVGGYARGPEPLRVDRRISRVPDDVAESDERTERQLVHGGLALDEMDGRVNMCPGVVAERQQ